MTIYPQSNPHENLSFWVQGLYIIHCCIHDTWPNEFISLIRWTGFLVPYLPTSHCNDVGHFAQNLRFLKIVTTHPETEDEVLGTEGI